MKNDPLQDIRSELDSIDDRINDLLSERSMLAKKVGEIKGGERVYRPKREAEIVSRLVTQHTGALSASALAAIYSEIIGACRNLEQTLRVAYLGPAGSYSYAIARRLHGSTSDFLGEQTLKDVVLSVEQGFADVGVLPIENSTEGPIVETQKLLQSTNLHVVREATQAISHNLLSNVPLVEIKTVYAHPQSLGQCRAWIQSNVPRRARIVSAASNGEAARLAAKHAHAAAIASEEAAEIYGLKNVATAINDESGNETRFFVLSKNAAEPTGNDKTTVIITLKDRYGSLYALLGGFVTYKIDLTNLKSQPASGGLHTFFIEFRGHKNEPHVAKALEEIKAHSARCKIIGSYPKEERYA